jgi:cytochrome c oxidase subunit 2
MQKKVAEINRIRTEKSKELVAKNEVALDPYTFDYLLLCKKICGQSHYNMQMKITVVDEAEFKTWLSDKKTVSQALIEKPVEEVLPEVIESTVVDTTLVVQNLK